MKSMTLSELAVIAKQIGGIISCSMGLITFLTLAIKPLRKIAAKTISHMAKESEFESVLKELRKDIAEIKEENTPSIFATLSFGLGKLSELKLISEISTGRGV